MNNDLIDREALKEEIVKLCEHINANNGITVPTLAFTRIIDNAPAVERPIVDSCDMNVFEPEKHMKNQAKDKPLKQQVREKSDGPFFGCMGK